MAEVKHRQMSIDEILEDFSYLDDWDDRYRYLIELGKTLEPMSEDQHNMNTKVQGCVSQVWISSSVVPGDPPVLHFIGDSDAHIVRGLVAISLALYSNQPARKILDIDAFEVFSEIGLQEHLTPQRSNGLRAMIERIKRDAVQANDGQG